MFMTVFKCKMCGGNIEFEQGATVGVCDSCGTKQTLPRLDDDRRANLYDRANHFRRNNEFDKAIGIYEQILNEDNTDAEAYWSLVLCRYGIEYVEDPATHKRIPTVNRAQFTSVFDDDNYKSALAYADGYQQEIYEEEANAINEIQKGILEISQREDPFDVFICYKESDANGRRTQDSVLANDLYHQLMQEGFKVFFARITLEDKLGTAYEPYIFAALNSSKVMVVLGTKPEYFSAVWVKNEWSRYLALVKESAGKKVLIPAYRDMDPYDLPEEFSHLQAQDMSKLGFMQDLIRGIRKIIGANELKEMTNETVVVGNAASVAPLLKRAFMFLEDEEWDRADDFCEQVLNQEPENAQAYLGKLMAELRVRRQEDLSDCEQPFNGSNNFQKAVRFGDDKIAGMLSGYIDIINKRNENMRLTSIYDNAVNAMKLANSESSYKVVATKFKTIIGYRDAELLAEQCLDRAEVCRKDEVYRSAKSLMTGSTVSGYEAAIEVFSTISGWKDADEQIYTCQRKIEEIKAKEEADQLEYERQAEERRIAAEKAARTRKRATIITFVSVIVIAAGIAFGITLKTVIIPGNKYGSAMELYYSQQYEEAYQIFNSLNYGDSSDKAAECLFMVQKSRFTDVSVGSTIRFGAYEQDNNISDGKEEIEWEVLAIDGNKALIISRYALDCQQFNINIKSNTNWEACSLRAWLNDTFYNTAFSTYHQKIIDRATVSADENPVYDTSPGNGTLDWVFLLSIKEVSEYLPVSDSLHCQGTDYSHANVTYRYPDGYCDWWLRSPGVDTDYVVYVDRSGTVITRGCKVDCSNAVRPALWINFGS